MLSATRNHASDYTTGGWCQYCALQSSEITHQFITISAHTVNEIFAGFLEDIEHILQLLVESRRNMEIGLKYGQVRRRNNGRRRHGFTGGDGLAGSIQRWISRTGCQSVHFSFLTQRSRRCEGARRNDLVSGMQHGPFQNIIAEKKSANFFIVRRSCSKRAA